ncbi:MAG TPA: hypothetical protein VIY48_11660 [Candidatus Paceibacterota bacterium]
MARTRIAGEEYFAPELFARAEQLVWHYGLFSITNSRAQELKERWLSEHGEDAGQAPRDLRKTRILVLAGRSLYFNPHECVESCSDLPVSPYAGLSVLTKDRARSVKV